MLNINPISYNLSNYHMVKTNKKVNPISGVSKASNNRKNNSNSSEFKEELEQEIKKQKQKQKKIKREE